MGHDDDDDVDKEARQVEAEVDNVGDGDSKVVPCEVVVEPERNMVSAADVVVAMAVAAGGRGWLCFPS